MILPSKRIDYGLLLMATLPEPLETRYRSLQEIAAEKHLSAGFLSQVMMPLKKAGLVRSKEGLHGGYQLAKPSQDITLRAIYEALEGPVKLTACQDPSKKCLCESHCPTKGLWSDLQKLMSGYLQEKTLSEFKIPHV